MPVQIVTAPAAEPISLAEAKNHLRVDYVDDDHLIQSQIIAVREYAETSTNRAFVTQTWKYVLDAFPALPQSSLSWQDNFDQFRIPFPPLQSVTSIVWIDQNGNSNTIPPANYIVDATSEPARVALNVGQIWPADTLQPIAGVQVTFTAGYGAPGRVPESLKQMMKLLLGAWYQNREDVVVDRRVAAVELPKGFEALRWRNWTPPVLDSDRL
jgi:uncharacterized phiE125 gp8 family phage protein